MQNLPCPFTEQKSNSRMFRTQAHVGVTSTAQVADPSPCPLTPDTASLLALIPPCPHHGDEESRSVLQVPQAWRIGVQSE